MQKLSVHVRVRQQSAGPRLLIKCASHMPHLLCVRPSTVQVIEKVSVALLAEQAEPLSLADATHAQ